MRARIVSVVADILMALAALFLFFFGDAFIWPLTCVFVSSVSGQRYAPL